MRRRLLGHTALSVSELGLGTASLGADYGIAAEGEFGRPTSLAAVRLVREAVEHGITFFDTAPGYGESERLLGRALAGRDGCVVATKVTVSSDARASVEASLRALRREALDIVQIHNATEDALARGEILATLRDLVREGKARFVGATVYTEAEALAAIQAGVDVLQVAHNILDRRMAARIFPAASAAGVGVVLRSAFLKGALTEKAEWLPLELAELRRAAEQARDHIAGSWEALPGAALRFCLSEPRAACVLTGARTLAELEHALAAAEAGPLEDELLARVAELEVADERLLNPSSWTAVA